MFSEIHFCYLFATTHCLYNLGSETRTLKHLLLFNLCCFGMGLLPAPCYKLITAGHRATLFISQKSYFISCFLQVVCFPSVDSTSHLYSLLLPQSDVSVISTSQTLYTNGSYVDIGRVCFICSASWYQIFDF